MLGNAFNDCVRKEFRRSLKRKMASGNARKSWAKNYETTLPPRKKNDNNNNSVRIHKDRSHTHCWVNSNTLHRWRGEGNDGDTVLPRMYKQRSLEQYRRRLPKTVIQTIATLFCNQTSSRLVVTCLHDFDQLQAFVHILASGKETLKHQNFEVIVHVAVDTTHYLHAKQYH